MDYHQGSSSSSSRSSSSSISSFSHLVIGRRQGLILTPKCSLFMAFVVVGITVAAAILIQPANGQDQNAPPILYVRERNWRISEAEQVGQIIDRVRAEDPDGDDLEFGLEPRFTPNVGASPNKLPFRIDPVTGVVYLNETLQGRAGENFLIYITVSDGRYTAKNEVFINILGPNENQYSFSGGRQPPSISNVVQNISHFLPSFDKLPGVQSIRNQLPNRRPTNNLPPGFPNFGGLNNFYPTINQQAPLFNTGQEINNIPTSSSSSSDEEAATSQLMTQLNTSTPTISTTTATKTTSSSSSSSSSSTTVGSRTKLTPISVHSDTKAPVANHNDKNTPQNVDQKLKPDDNNSNNSNNNATTTTATTNSMASLPFKTTIIPVVITICSLFVAVAVIVGFLYRKRLCAVSKKLKSKSKEEMAKKSNQSNLSSTLTDDSRNSMVMQHWDGPMAHGNRYVPWERDAQMAMATSQLSTSATHNEPNTIGGASGQGAVASSSGANVNGIGVNGGGIAAASSNKGKYDRWEFPRHRLKFFNILGEGAFGQVWRCEATDIDGIEGVTTVAVKTLKESAAEIEKKDLLSELEVMKSLEPHVNVVRLLGCCTDKDPTFVIIEYVNRGKLQTYLRNSRAERHYGNTHGKSNILTSGDLTSFMYQVAKGMDYLTSRGIIHRDLAARNILITEDHTCKVADFGFARDIITSKIYERKSEGKLPIRWMATESLYDNIFSVKSDIWSFGILMWEIVTLGSTPYPGISAADVMRKVRDGYRLEKPEHCRRELYNIMYYCWSDDANERPTFGEIVNMLDKLLHTEMDYIELERFPDHNYYNIINLSGEKL